MKSPRRESWCKKHLSRNSSIVRHIVSILLIGLTVSEAFAPPAATRLQRQVHHHNHANQSWRQIQRVVVRQHELIVLWEERNSRLSEADFAVVNEHSTASENDEDDDVTYAIAFRNTILSIAVAILFGAGLWVIAGPIVGEEYFAGYIVEKSLSVDNLFVFLLLFDYFRVPTQYQGRILTWGIYGSVVMRSIMIGLGAAALQNFRGILLVFAGILIYSSIQVLVDVEEELIEKEDDISDNPVVRLSRYLCESNESCNIDDFDDEELKNPVVMLSRSIFPSTKTYDGDRFFTMENGIKKATPLFVCMVAVELSDVVFAVDSIPAVFGVTENPLVVFSSNMFAILGLRSLYPVLSKAVTDLKYLEPAVAVILAFIGVKMILEYFEYVIPTEAALAVIISLLAVGVGASIWEKNSRKAKESSSDEIG